MKWLQKPGPSGGGRLPRRRTDWLEDGAAWVLTTVGLFVLILSALAGARAGAEAAERGRVAADERVRVEAVVVDVAAVPDAELDADSMGWVTVRYADTTGRTHEGILWMTPLPSADASVQVCVDRAGQLAPAAPGAGDPLVIGAMVGLVAAGTGGLLLVFTWLGVQGVVDQRNGSAWAREWEKVEPEWSGRRSNS